MNNKTTLKEEQTLYCKHMKLTTLNILKWVI